MAVFEFPSAQSIKDMMASEVLNAGNDLRKLTGAGGYSGRRLYRGC
jgi:hypothetical protein